MLALSLLATALHPRPEYSDYASFARWLVHESDYTVVRCCPKKKPGLSRLS